MTADAELKRRVRSDAVTATGSARALGERAKKSRCDVFEKRRSRSKENCFASNSQRKATMRREWADKAFANIINIVKSNNEM